MGRPASDSRFRLCLALGWPHPDYLLELLTGEQLGDWADYYSREPWGFPVEDMRSSMAMAVAANVGGSKMAPADFSMATAPEDELDEGSALMLQLHWMMPTRPAPPPAAPAEEPPAAPAEE